MPRLLSNVPAKKICEQKDLGPKKVSEQKAIKPPKIVEGMSSWEYYSFLMRFGKRKMLRHEWVIWKEKKDNEDWNKRYIKNEEGRFVKIISSKEFNYRIKYDKDFDERFVYVDHKLK